MLKKQKNVFKRILNILFKWKTSLFLTTLTDLAIGFKHELLLL